MVYIKPCKTDAITLGIKEYNEKLFRVEVREIRGIFQT